MSLISRELLRREFPPSLLEIPEPPEKLWVSGNLPDESFIRICFVGSRKHTTYGSEACKALISGLRGHPIAIVSGLALGIDAIAHRAALDAKLPTIAVPGSGLGEKVLYPRSHLGLAEEIVHCGGALLSEFEPNFTGAPWSFPQRNRIMAGLSRAVVVIEAEVPSGTLITSRLATDYNKDVLTVPGSIFSPQSAGPHLLLTLGATPIRTSFDILQAVGIASDESKTSFSLEDLSEDEKVLFDALKIPLERDELIRISKLPNQRFNAALTLLELRGAVHQTLGEISRM